jgi:hypothetical protein
MYETKPVALLGMIVEAESANPGLKAGQFLPAQNCDHFDIAQLGGGDSPVYQSVSEFLKSPAQSVQPQVCTEVEPASFNWRSWRLRSSAPPLDGTGFRMLEQLEPRRRSSECI